MGQHNPPAYLLGGRMRAFVVARNGPGLAVLHTYREFHALRQHRHQVLGTLPAQLGQPVRRVAAGTLLIRANSLIVERDVAHNREQCVLQGLPSCRRGHP